MALLGDTRRFELSEIGFVGFNNFAFAAKRAGVHVFHRFTDAMRHEPCGLVGDAERAVQLMAADMPFLDEPRRCIASHHLLSGILERSNTVPTVTVNWPLHSLQ